MAEGIHPASASRNRNGTPDPTRSPGHSATVEKSARGRLTAAASNVDTASSSTTSLMDRSSPRNRPHQSSAQPGAMTAAASTASGQSTPSANPTR